MNQQHDRHDQQRGQRQPAVEHEHGDHDADQREHAGEEGGDVLRDGLVDGVDIVGQAAHQLAGGMRVEEADRKLLQVVEEVAAQALEGALREARHDPVGQGGEQVGQEVDQEHQQGDAQQALRVIAVDETVDGHAHQVRTDQAQQGVGDHADQHAGERKAEGLEVGQQAQQGPSGLRGFLDRSAEGADRPCRGCRCSGAGARRAGQRRCRWRSSSQACLELEACPVDLFLEAVAELRGVDFLVDRAGADQLGMGALGGDATVVDHDDLVGPQDGADALGDDEAGAIFHDHLQGVLDLRLGLDIDRAGAVVQDQDPGLEQQGAGDGDALLLPAGEVDAALFDVGVVALGQLQDELVGLGGPGGSYHFFLAGCGPAVADIIAHAAREEDRLLRHDADLRQERILPDGADIQAVDFARGPRKGHRSAGSG